MARRRGQVRCLWVVITANAMEHAREKSLAAAMDGKLFTENLP
jgi:hypothetical protein